MKKLSTFALVLLLASCDIAITSNNSTISIPDGSVNESTPINDNNSSQDSTEIIETKTIKEINEMGALLNEGETGNKVNFKGTYIKKISDNSDKIMLFADSQAYIYVRVPSSKWTDYLDNRYLDVSYDVTGTLTKKNGNIELDYLSLSNISDLVTVNYETISEKKNSIAEVYEEFSKLTLTEKFSGIGKIVTVEGQLIATESEDANKKCVIYDDNNVITIINDKKIADPKEIGKTFKITGSLSVLKSSPALLLLDKEIINNETQEINTESAKEVKPSYFSKWYTLSDHMTPPALNDYSFLYTTTGYVKSNDIGGKYYLGVVDTPTGTLKFQSNERSIKGFFLKNNLNLDDNSIVYSPFLPYFEETFPVTFCFTMHQFETQWHGWKMFPIDSTIPLVEEPVL